jgi:hypothetical protein
MSSWKRLALAFLLAVMVTCVPACSRPMREGPNLAGVPAGFHYDENMSSGRPVLPKRVQVGQSGWMSLDEPSCSITFTEYSGTTTDAELRAAVAEAAQRYRSEDFTPVEPIRIDGREAWGWIETQTYGGQLASVEYTAVIPYDNVTWAVEYYASNPKLRDPRLQKDLVSSFHYQRSR